MRLEASVNGGTIRAGEGRVVQVLDNLLSNALDATPAGASIMVTADGGELHVVDEGAGLTPEQRERAFDRFWRASKAPGSGLGLPIARRLVELDGGTIELRGASTGGVDAVVHYPVTPYLRPRRPVRDLCSGPVATMTRMHAGFTGVVQHDVAAAAGLGAAAAARHARRADACRASARHSRSGCARSASDRARPAVPCASPVRERGRPGGDREARERRGRSCDRGSNSQRSRAAPTRQTDARHRDRPGRQRRSGQRVVLQPTVARGEARSGHQRCGCAGKLGRYGFDVKSYDIGEARADGRLRAGLSGKRAGPVDAAAGARARRARARRAKLSRSASGRARAAVPPRRARGDSLSCRRASGRGRLDAGSRSTSS